MTSDTQKPASKPVSDDGRGELVALVEHVAGGGPHEWGYRDVTDGTFIADDWPFRAAAFLSALTNTPANAEVVEVLREARAGLNAAIQWGCPVCSGDCASANPPVSACPIRDYSQTISRIDRILGE